uniref:Amino acid transporter transmembrane domain-containing protein n=1 Tax=Rhizophora mucronata TaxID=61149 RepID=A0A2P2JY87_RHIMU
MVGSWLHCGYHLTTSIVSPVLLGLPFALSLLGWVPGVVCLTLATLLTFYCFYLLSVILEHHAQLGKRQLRFRDMARDILGPGWDKFFVGPLQFLICYGAVILGTLLGGQNLKFIYLLNNPNGEMQLYLFIIMFGAATLILAQMPSFHSLRHINLVSLMLSLAYGAGVTAGSIYIGKITRDKTLSEVPIHVLIRCAKTINYPAGHSKNAPSRDYSVKGTPVNRFLSALSGISIMATAFGCGIVPEIQATLAPPLKGKMFKGLCVCYGVIVSTFFSVGISGYWAFGNQIVGTILTNFMGGGKPLLPSWFLLVINIFTLAQITATTVIYLQPTNEMFEKWLADAKMDQFSIRNVVPRLIFRSLSVTVATLFAAMLPFFGDILALFGAFGIIPLDCVLPIVFYNVTFKPIKQSTVFWGHTLIAIVSSMVAAVGTVASVRQIVLDAKTYNLFANM